MSKADKYLDMDNKIHVNYNKMVAERGWVQETRTAAKKTMNTIMGLSASDAMASIPLRANTQNRARINVISHKNLLKSKRGGNSKIHSTF